MLDKLMIHDIVLLCGWTATAIILGVALMVYRRKFRARKTALRQLRFARDCVFDLMGKASESLRDHPDLASFLRVFAEHVAHSLLAQSVVFLRYNAAARTLHGAALVGAFPSLIHAEAHILDKISTTPSRVQSYLMHTAFPLLDTPFVETVSQTRAMAFDEERVRERLRNGVAECWGMLSVPVSVGGQVFGVLAIVNKANHLRFTQDDVVLATNLAEMAGIVISQLLSLQDMEAKRRLDQQLDTAKIIQEHLLPQHTPQDERFDLAAYYHPADRLGGDYYDFVDVDTEHLGILIADVSGKGIPAGLVMATMRSAFAILTQAELSPAQVLRKLNMLLLRLIPEEMFISATYGILHRTTGEFVCARAGHEPIVSCLHGREVSSTMSRGEGMVVGMVDDAVFSPTLHDEYFQLKPGEIIMLYTDGITEAQNSLGQEFGRLRLSQALQTVTQMEAGQAVETIVNRVHRFADKEAAHDDMTIVLIKAK